MTPDERKHWDVVIARIKKHKEKCDYHEPEMLAILAADAELKRQLNEIRILEDVAERLDKKLSEEYIKTMTLRARVEVLEKVANLYSALFRGATPNTDMIIVTRDTTMK